LQAQQLQQQLQQAQLQAQCQQQHAPQQAGQAHGLAQQWPHSQHPQADVHQQQTQHLKSLLGLGL